MVHAYQTHINSGSASLIRNFEVGVVQTLPRIQKSESVEKQIRTRITPGSSFIPDSASVQNNTTCFSGTSLIRRFSVYKQQ